jgi:malonyl-CoA O-methyltransferase
MNCFVNVCNNLDAEASHYSKHAIMQAEVGERMLARLQYFKIDPQLILDLGCGPGLMIPHLRHFYPKAKILGVDYALNMLKHIQSKRHWWQAKIPLVQADACRLPFAKHSVDLIMANQLLPYLNEPQVFFQECIRVLKTDGLLLFSSLGPDTYKEFGLSGSERKPFLDMHDLGDMLQHIGFRDPVMDREDLVLHYPNKTALMTALFAQGEPCQAWDYINSTASPCPLTYELIYGQAWGGPQRSQAGVQTIPLEKLRRTIPSQSR